MPKEVWTGTVNGSTVRVIYTPATAVPVAHDKITVEALSKDALGADSWRDAGGLMVETLQAALIAIAKLG